MKKQKKNSDDKIVKNEIYDDPRFCNKCNSKNDLEIKNIIDSIVIEYKTICTICGHKDLWVTGFFKSRSQGLNKSTKY